MIPFAVEIQGVSEEGQGVWVLAVDREGLLTANKDGELAWYPLAQASRRLFPAAFKQLDEAAGGVFPFTKEQVQAAHARCSSQWLVWERQSISSP